LPPTVEDDPGFVVLSEPESWRLGFAARHDGLTNLRMARGVVRSLPATLAISRVPAAAALRNDDNVKGPSGKNTAAASTRVITSSSPHWAGSGRALARTSLSVLRLRMFGRGTYEFARPLPRPFCSTCTRNLLFEMLDALAGAAIGDFGVQIGRLRTLNHRVPGSSPGAPTTQSLQTAGLRHDAK
jgi:hypothetical protein